MPQGGGQTAQGQGGTQITLEEALATIRTRGNLPAGWLFEGSFQDAVEKTFGSSWRLINAKVTPREVGTLGEGAFSFRVTLLAMAAGKTKTLDMSVSMGQGKRGEESAAPLHQLMMSWLQEEVDNNTSHREVGVNLSRRFKALMKAGGHTAPNGLLQPITVALQVESDGQTPKWTVVMGAASFESDFESDTEELVKGLSEKEKLEEQLLQLQDELAKADATDVALIEAIQGKIESMSDELMDIAP